MNDWLKILQKDGKNALWEYVHQMAMAHKSRLIYKLSSCFSATLAEKNKLAEDCLSEGVRKLVDDFAEKTAENAHKTITVGLIFSYSQNKLWNKYGKDRKANKTLFQADMYQENLNQVFQEYGIDLLPDDVLETQLMLNILQQMIDIVCYKLLSLKYIDLLSYTEILNLAVPELADFTHEGSLRNKASKCINTYRKHPQIIALQS